MAAGRGLGLIFGGGAVDKNLVKLKSSGGGEIRKFSSGRGGAPFIPPVGKDLQCQRQN